MHRKIIVFSIILISLLLVSGCVDVNYVIEFDKDERVKTSLIAEIDKTAAKSKEQVEQFILNNLYHNLEEANQFPILHSYKLYETENHYIFELSGPPSRNLDTLHFGDLYGISNDGINFSGTEINYNPFYVSKSFTGKVSITQSRNDGYLVLKHLQGQDVDIRVTVKSYSFKFDNHNADETYDRGRELVWIINPYEVNEVKFGYTIRENYMLAILIIISIFIVLILMKKIIKINNLKHGL